MAFIDNEEINNIRQTANIIDIISSYIPLEQKGRNYFGVCPFHNDHSPSMSVSSEKQIYKCFSCGATGNVFTFVQNYENLSFVESVVLVAKKVGINIKSNIEENKTSKYDKYYKIMDTSLKFYMNNLNTNDGLTAKEYLLKRDINESIIKEFRIGLSLDSNNTLTNLLIKKNIDKKDMLDLGLSNKDGLDYYDVFTKRIMFPLEDVNGNVVGFSGRIYKTDNTSKYVNTRETLIFKKGYMLFNYHRAKDSIKRLGYVIIVEGFMDAIRLYSCNITNVIAIMGTSLTTEQINFIKKLRCKVMLCLDNDNAGNTATYSIGESLEANNVNVSIIKLNDSKDPDEYIVKYGIENFNNKINTSITFSDFKLNYLKKDKNLNNSEDLANYINEVLSSLTKSNDEILKEITIKKLSKEFDISYNLLKEKLNLNNKIVKEKKKDPIIIENKKDKYDVACERVLYYMMNDFKYIKSFQNNIGYFSKKIYREVANEIIYYYEENKNISVADFITFSLKNEHVYSLVLSIISNSSDDEINQSNFNIYLDLVKEHNVKSEISILKERLKNELDSEKKLIIAEKIAKLKKGVFNNG